MKDSYDGKICWLQDQLLAYDSSLKKRVEQTCKNFNTTIRGHIRTETALRLGSSPEEGSASVPIKVVDELPRAFKPIIEDLDPIFWELFLKRALLKDTALGLELIDNRAPEMLALMERYHDPSYGIDFYPDDMFSLRGFIDQFLDLLDYRGILRRLRELEQGANVQSEVLGSYYFGVPEIQIHWMAIALISIELGVTAEALTVVTLTHELVHAYTHLGQDTDNEKWFTEAFAKTDPMIVEGLAQFYTEIICKKLEHRQPKATTAFLELLKYQSEPYTDYQSWLPQEVGRGEIVRSAMIECRKKRITYFPEFMDVLKSAQYRISIYSDLAPNDLNLVAMLLQ